MTAGALERVIRRAAARRQQSGQARQCCQLCGQPVPDGHRHLVDTHSGEPLCACYPCSVLFNRDQASQGHYRLIPDRRIRLTGLSTTALGVPVGLAFFVRQADGRVVAHYPSPAGATRWEIDPGAWGRAVRECPALADLAPDVEAALVNTARGRDEAWLVPLDDCWRLVAIVRQQWKGLSGGDQVWPEIDRFFDELRTS
ncbi:MAG TPA: DUF5947 family protein [Streptosporangiaceae bacterium]|nr:DUF5947 family protein [Streptosporangiaceae bacterium]